MLLEVNISDIPKPEENKNEKNKRKDQKPSKKLKKIKGWNFASEIEQLLPKMCNDCLLYW